MRASKLRHLLRGPKSSIHGFSKNCRRLLHKKWDEQKTRSTFFNKLINVLGCDHCSHIPITRCNQKIWSSSESVETTYQHLKSYKISTISKMGSFHITLNYHSTLITKLNFFAFDATENHPNMNWSNIRKTCEILRQRVWGQAITGGEFMQRRDILFTGEGIRLGGRRFHFCPMIDEDCLTENEK